MKFSEEIKLAAGSATINNAAGNVVATLTASKSFVDNSRLVLTSSPDLMLSPSTDYFVNIPDGMVTDMANNGFSGLSQCSGCDWPFSTATTQAPTIVNTPGALCNNTIEPGVIAVTPYVDSTGVSVTTSSISFRWCDNVTVGSKGFISVKNKAGDYTVTGLDLSKTWTEVMTMSQTKPYTDDTLTVNFASNALTYQTTYTVTVPAGTFFSRTGESNAPYSWDFTTGGFPPPLKVRATFPTHQVVYNRTKITYASINYNDTVLVGSSGTINLYRDFGAGAGFERILSADVGGNLSFVTSYLTSQSRRSMGAPRLRRGASVTAATHQCAGSCVTTVGSQVRMQIPSALNAIVDGQRYQGSIDKGAVTGSLGQLAPAVAKEDWLFITAAPLTAAPFNLPPVALAVGGGAGATASASSAKFNLWLLVGAMCALLIGAVGAAAMYMHYNKPTHEEFEDEDDDQLVKIHDMDEFSDDDSDWEDEEGEDGEATRTEGPDALGKAPGKAAKAYNDRPPVGPEAVPACAAVALLSARVEKLNHAAAAAAADPTDPLKDELRKISFEDPSGGGAHNVVSDDSDAQDITKSDIKSAAAGICAAEGLLSGKKKNPWKTKASLMQLKVLTEKMESIGEPMPCMVALHQAALLSQKPDSNITKGELKYLAAQAWPEVTRLRLERAAKLQNTKMHKAVVSCLSDSLTEQELARVGNSIFNDSDKMAGEAKILQASCQVGCLVPMFGLLDAEIKELGEEKEDNPLAKDDQGVGIEMEGPPGLTDKQKLDAVTEITGKHRELLAQAAKQIHGGAVKLDAAIKTLEDINSSPETDDLSPKQIDDLLDAIKKLAEPMIYLHAENKSIAGPILEKLLVAAQRVATGDSSAYYLQAVIEEVKPQLLRIKEKESEAIELDRVCGALEEIVISNKEDQAKIDNLTKVLEDEKKGIQKVLNGHKLRYAGWLHEVPTFSFKQPASNSQELAALSQVVATCESITQRGNDDAIVAANSEVKKLYRKSPIAKGIPEKFARCLVEMEHFAHMDEGHTDPAALESKIAEGVAPLQLLRDDSSMRVDMTGISSAFDLAQKIINNTKDDDEYYTGNKKLQEQFHDAVYDAWSNVAALQAEKHANTVCKDLVDHVDALYSNIIQKEDNQMTPDNFASQVVNNRSVLNNLLEEDKHMHNEKLLLGALRNLQNINDPDAVNVAVRETKSQLSNIEVTERNTAALKQMYDDFQLYLEDPDHATESLKDDIKAFADIVVHLGALEDDPVPIRSCLIVAARCISGKATKAEVQTLIDLVILPAVELHCSAPKSADLEALMATIKDIVDTQSGSLTVKEQTSAQMAAKAGQAKVKEEMDSHRKRLTYRTRMAVTRKADEMIDLRKAEKTGAEWDGFQVENVALKHAAEDNRSPCERAFDLFDIDEDGIITIDEVINYLLSVPPDERPAGLKDVNPFQKAKMRKRLQKMDTDNDGTLSFGEFETWWKSNNSAE
jgi:hypothetical protein